jgi:queuine tRNA-ribosyltransferase
MHLFEDIKLPIFMPDATLGAIRSLETSQIEAAGIKMLVVNTFHLFLSHGVEDMHELGGIKKLMDWKGKILSDSGGFQIYSLIHKNTKMGKITQYGAYFQSPIDGSEHLLTPEISIDMQIAIDSDILIVLDDCRPSNVSHKQAQKSVKLTTNWAKRAKAHFEENYASKPAHSNKQIFAVVQGGSFEDLRKQSAEELQEIGFDGYCFGGWPVDEQGDLVEDILSFTADLLPDEKPKYAMGVGKPGDIRKCLGFGYNMFDCVLPTRNARHGLIYTSQGPIRITKSKFKLDQASLDPDCNCLTCSRYSRAYLYHLFKAHEITGKTLATIHNITFYNSLFKNTH